MTHHRSALALSALVAAALSSGTAFAAPPPTAVGDIIVTEVMTEPQQVPNYYGQWFELYNASGTLLDLNGVIIRDGGGQEIQVTGSYLIASGDYVVLGVSSNTSNNGNIPVDIVYSFNSFQIDKTGDEILVYYNSVLLDDFTWTSAWGLSAIKARQLAPQGFTEWANGLEANWCDSQGYISPLGLYGTPGSANHYCTAAGNDNDGDTFTEQEGDCDDTDAFINPSTVDGVASPFGNANDDADCNGVRDDGVTDDDNDGYSEVDGDCDDTNALINPSRTEGRTPDGVDNDCNCWIDDVDTDGDRYPNQRNATQDPGIYATLSAADQANYCSDSSVNDCDDNEVTVYPGATEIPYDGIDQDCVDGDLCDVDADFYTAEACGGFDCDDDDPDVHPGSPDATVTPDGIDNDCDGLIDSPDIDNDGYGEADGDCDDNNPDVHPGIEGDLCGDYLDNNCNGFYNEGCTFPALTASVRGGSLFCGVTPGTESGSLLLSSLLMMVAASRRQRR